MSSNGSATPNDLMELLKQQKYRCALSGRPLEPANAVIDHIVPLIDGGTDEVDNLQWLDADVNRAKGSQGMSDFIQLCSDVHEHQQQPEEPRQQETHVPEEDVPLRGMYGPNE